MATPMEEIFKRTKHNRFVRRRRVVESDESADDDNLLDINNKRFKDRHTLNKSQSNTNSFRDNEAMVYYKSTKSSLPEGPADQGATRYLEIDRCPRTPSKVTSETKNGLKSRIHDRICHEQKCSRTGKEKYLKEKGPLKRPTFLRTTVRWDYQPDICKDFKETGFCGFGDSCIFLHDRSDYKFGWELKEEDATEDVEKFEIVQPVNTLPSKCFICRDNFKNPVVTKCGHWFCEKCALNNYRGNSRCYICAVQTEGVFKFAKNIGNFNS